MMREFLLFMPMVLAAGFAVAQPSVEKPLPLDGAIAANGRSVELRWPEAKPPLVGGVLMNRRRLGDRGAQSWRALGPASGPVMRVTDKTAEPGVAYEYQVLRMARDIVDVGYWTTGVELPAPEARGTVHLVVEQTIAGDLALHLQRFIRDLAGDGWRVSGSQAPRHDPRQPLRNLQMAASVKNWLRERYLADSAGTHTVVLVGHVPIPMSGRAAPDGHAPEPHASDLFYAEMNGEWRATAEGLLLENTLPSDAIEMQVGRIDFAGVSGGDRDLEVALLRAYFDKNHHWRRGLLGDLRQAYSQNGNLLVEQHGLRNIVGPEAVTAGGHHDAGELKPWLWGVDFGDYNGRNYATDHAVKAVFAINFGSGKQKIDRGFNAMTALLAQPWYPLAVGWGGRPAWRLHPMALGASIGDAHLRTVNNGVADEPYRESMDYFPTGSFLWRNPVWVNLLGDPTLRAFPLAPPGVVIAEETAAGVALSWTPSSDPDATGYRVFRTGSGSTDFTPLGEAPQDTLAFLDPAPPEGARYMVRSYGLKDVYAGSFFTYSQGVLAGPAADLAQDLTLAARAGQPLVLPEAFSAPQGGLIYAFIEGPATGALTRVATGWTYTPPADFTGDVVLRFSVSNALHTEQRHLTITVSE